MIGQTISHYRILSQLGAGGMGLVYRAEDLRLGRQVALKFLPPGATDHESVERFRREARTASALSHPNICTIYDIGEWEGRMFIAMEALKGTPLDKLIAAGPLTMAQAIDYATQIAEALDFAHTATIIHRDIKPANVFLTTRGQVKVLDFGLAKMTQPGRQHATMAGPTEVTPGHFTTVVGSTLGTIAYMSPEQARGEILDARSDLFSFGIVMYEMVTGRHTFPGSTTAVIFDAILNKVPVPPSALSADVSVELERIIGKALEKDRSLRYQTAAEIRADLERLRRSAAPGFGVAAGPSPSTLSEWGSSPASSASNSAARGDSRTLLVPGSGPVQTPPAPPMTPPPLPSASAPTGTVPPVPPVPVHVTPQPASLLGSATPPVSAAAPPPSSVAIAPAASNKALLVGIAGLLLVVGALGALLYVTWNRRAEPAASTTAATTPTPAPPPSDPAPAPATVAPETAPTTGETPRATTPGPAEAPAPRPTTAPTPVRPPVAAPEPPQREIPSPPAEPAPPPPTMADRPPRFGTPGRPGVAPPRGNAPSNVAPDDPDDFGGAGRDGHPIGQVIRRAEAFQRGGQTADALRAYREATASYPQHPRAAEAMFKAAQLMASAPRRSGGGPAMTPSSGGNAYERASRQMEGAALGPGAAHALLEDLVSQYPSSEWALRGLMFKAELEDRMDMEERDATLGTIPASVRSHRTIVERFGSTPAAEEALWRMAGTFERLGKVDVAVKTLTELSTKAPQTIRPVWFRLGDLYETKLKDSARARDAYGKVPKTSPDFAEAQRRIARLGA